MLKVVDRLLVVVMVAACFASAPVNAQDRDDAPPHEVTFTGLLYEMIDRSLLAEWPSPAYSTKQFSSYDRRSVSPDDPTDEGWFANGDAGKYLRSEERDGRTEWVMMEADGPGAIVRIWSANPSGIVRFYFDGEERASFEANLLELLNGTGPVPPPLSAVRARGANLYLPIPYHEHVKVTIESSNARGMYYQINYRTYEPGTMAQTFVPALLTTQRHHLETITKHLLNPASDDPPVRPVMAAAPLAPGKTQLVFEANEGGAIDHLEVKIPFGEMDDPAPVLRALIVRMTFDGERAVECPLGDFFGSAPGLVPYESWYAAVLADGRFKSRWYMPWESSARIEIINRGESAVWVMPFVRTVEHEWTDRSMHFRADWRIERDIPTRPRRDWNYLNVRGRGVFAGDMLVVSNPLEDWWGEGDEKIYIDGETFPSHFGTGTEDYYGYAWCSPEVFQAPFHNQPRCDGPANYGQTSVNRTRALDAIPFEDSFNFDMEIWHWRDCTVHYAATMWWYATPGASDNTPPIAQSMIATVPTVPPLPPPFRIDGAVEGETLGIVAHSPGLTIAHQALWKKDTYSNDAHLWVQARNVGDFVELRVPNDEPGKREVIIHLTRSWDYGIIRCFINGEPAGEPIDTFNGGGRELGATGPVSLGVHELGDSFVLRIEAVGTNEQSEPPHYFFGVDAVVLD